MHILMISIGKWKQSPEKALFEHYAQRLPWRLELKEVASKELPDKAKQKQVEAEAIAKAAEGFGASHLFVLDESGKELSSRALAGELGKLKDEGIARVAFVIGGHAGLSKALLKTAYRTLSFGKVTWPHLLVRSLLAEQLYRSYSILTNHPYHRD